MQHDLASTTGSTVENASDILYRHRSTQYTVLSSCTNFDTADLCHFNKATRFILSLTLTERKGLFFVTTMNDHHHDDDEDDDQEMVRLISKSDHVVQCKNPQKSSKKTRMTKCSDMKPLEVMHSSTRRRFNGKPSTFACRTGATIVSLSVAIGLWIWSGRKVNENTSILRWNSLKLRDIHHWCLDVSVWKSTLQNDSDLTLNLLFLLR